MSSHKLHIAGKAVGLHGSLIDTDFRKQRVLCSDPWEFVALWLKRDHQKGEHAKPGEAFIKVDSK
ncbi:hypothetical protein C8R34_105104 [Nitrosomonas sp. Nm84]|nr:hypothetical protein C8R34_105104 [Nitrosomonas sp. Nm84]